MTSPIVRTARLTDEQQSAVLALVAAAQEQDGVAPMSEQSLLAVRGRSGRPVEHLLAYVGRTTSSGTSRSTRGRRPPPSCVVAPVAPSAGGRVGAAGRIRPGTRIWAHGDLPASDAFAAAHGLEVVRELFVLGRRFDEAGPVDEPVLPEGLVARPFRPGHDEAEWLRVNAAAFAHHAEQGRMTRADLDARMEESWFDPEGLILVVPEDDPDTVAASHWTKTTFRRLRVRSTSSRSTPHTKGRVWGGR